MVRWRGYLASDNSCFMSGWDGTPHEGKVLHLGDPSRVAVIPGFGPGDYDYVNLLRSLSGVSVVTITGEGGFGASNT